MSGIGNTRDRYHMLSISSWVWGAIASFTLAFIFLFEYARRQRIRVIRAESERDAMADYIRIERAAAIERCAEIADEEVTQSEKDPGFSHGLLIQKETALRIASAIRTLGRYYD